jgi:hypothetical protein
MCERPFLAAGCIVTLLVVMTGPAVAAEGVGNTTAQSAIKPAKAQRLATAGVLTAKDMPGFTATAQSAPAHWTADQRAIYKCLGAKIPTYAVRNFGTAFTADPMEVDSSADVISTVAAAQADMAALTSGKATGCVKQQLVRVLKRAGATINALTVKRIEVTVKGADAVFAYRYTVKFTLNRTQAKLVGHEINFLVGQTEIDLSPHIYNAPQPSVDTTLILAKRLAKRVRAV